MQQTTATKFNDALYRLGERYPDSTAAASAAMGLLGINVLGTTPASSTTTYLFEYQREDGKWSHATLQTAAPEAEAMWTIVEGVQDIRALQREFRSEFGE